MSQFLDRLERVRGLPVMIGALLVFANLVVRALIYFLVPPDQPLGFVLFLLADGNLLLTHDEIAQTPQRRNQGFAQTDRVFDDTHHAGVVFPTVHVEKYAALALPHIAPRSVRGRQRHGEFPVAVQPLDFQVDGKDVARASDRCMGVDILRLERQVEPASVDNGRASFEQSAFVQRVQMTEADEIVGQARQMRREQP